MIENNVEKALDRPRYRVGNHQPQNIYDGDAYIGVMFSPGHAARVVAALNITEERSASEWWGSDRRGGYGALRGSGVGPGNRDTPTGQ